LSRTLATGCATSIIYFRFADTSPQMGLEFRESAYLLSAKNGRKLRSGMVFNLALGFQDLVEGGKK
jgi:nucleosome binding factor SPN SPT16 subunit